MEYICTSYKKLNKEYIKSKSKGKVIIKHIAKFNNIYVVEADDSYSIELLDVFTKFRPSRIFSLARDTQDEVMFTPHVLKKGLRQTQSVGWGMKVAILDSGVKTRYCNKVIESKDFTGNGSNIIEDHGTYVGKIINYYAPGACILSLKVSHDGHDIEEGNIITALDYCIDKEVDIINLSLETKQNDNCNGDCDVCSYLNDIVNEGIVAVSAAGNYGRFEGNTIGCPGRSERAITVGAVNNKCELSDYSGKGIPGFLKPNILAPGSVSILMGTKYINDSGTSYAAPIITGILTSLIPTHGKEVIISKLYRTCKDLGLEKYEQGFGLLDINKLTEVSDSEEAIPSSS